MLRTRTELIDLATLDLRPFDYLRPDQPDAFGAIAERMLTSRAILFATPVYWYAMSGRMKTLFDRFSDLLSDRDPGGRGQGLAGCEMWMLAEGTDPDLPPGFEESFARSARYLDMRWRGGCYIPACDAEAAAVRLAAFARRIDGKARPNTKRAAPKDRPDRFDAPGDQKLA